MSEDVKPRQWKIKILFNRIAGSNSFEVFQIAEGLLIKEKDTVKVIELEPTMRLMKEMCEKLLEAQSSEKEMIFEANGFPGFDGPMIIETKYDEVLEKYRKFKDGLK